MKYLYVEEPLLDHAKTHAIHKKTGAMLISIQRYGEVFNRHKGNFRLPLSTFKEMERVKSKEELLAIYTQKKEMMAFAKEEETLSFCQMLLCARLSHPTWNGPYPLL